MLNVPYQQQSCHLHKQCGRSSYEIESGRRDAFFGNGVDESLPPALSSQYQHSQGFTETTQLLLVTT